jgi:hypothetical protein
MRKMPQRNWTKGSKQRCASGKRTGYKNNRKELIRYHGRCCSDHSFYDTFKIYCLNFVAVLILPGSRGGLVDRWGREGYVDVGSTGWFPIPNSRCCHCTQIGLTLIAVRPSASIRWGSTTMTTIDLGSFTLQVVFLHHSSLVRFC